MEELRKEVHWFLKNCGHVAYPFLRMYLRTAIEEALKSHTKEEVEDVVRSETEAVARELGIEDPSNWLV